MRMGQENFYAMWIDDKNSKTAVRLAKSMYEEEKAVSRMCVCI